MPTQEKEESFSRSNDSTVSRSNSATLSQEDAETIPHSTDHTVPQSNKTTDSQGNKGTASRPIRTTAPQNTVEPVQQDTADTTPQENTENLDQIDLLANGYDPFKEFADSAEDCNDKKSEEQSTVSAFPQNNEETREQGKGPEEYDPFEQFDLQSDDSSEPPTEQNEETTTSFKTVPQIQRKTLICRSRETLKLFSPPMFLCKIKGTAKQKNSMTVRPSNRKTVPQ